LASFGQSSYVVVRCCTPDGTLRNLPGIFQAQEPILVDPFDPHFAVEGFGKSTIRRV